MRWVFGILYLMILYGCAISPQAKPQEVQKDLIDPKVQNIALFATQMNYTLKRQEELASIYKKHHFSIWNQTTSKHNDLKNFFTWVIEDSRKKTGFGENLLPNSSTWIESLIDNMQFEHYPNRSQAAIMIEDSSLRLMPTLKPRFFDAKLAGEGYPFDHWQNSGIYASTPVIVLQESRDKRWYLVRSSFASGWVPQEHVAFIQSKDQQAIKHQAWVLALNDRVNIYDDQGFFLQDAKVGKFFFLNRENKDHYNLNIPTRGPHAQLIWRSAKVSKQDFTTFPLIWNQANITQIAQSLLDQKYGWGGLWHNRDCSTLTRDFFGSFGIWLPRNSAAQAHDKTQGTYMALSEDKHLQILQNAIPWASLLWFQGHIMIYIGEYEEKAMVFHSIWGLKTLQNNQEGRYVIGRSLINDLYIGEHSPVINQEQLLIRRVEGIKNLFSKEDIYQSNSHQTEG